MAQSIGLRLEKYTQVCPEVLMVELVNTQGEPDTVTIFKGFSSSLVNPTNFDPDIPIIEVDAEIKAIDRLKAPYNPDKPEYIQQGLTLAEMEQLLGQMGI